MKDSLLRERVLRYIFHIIGYIFNVIFTRTRVVGIENLPKEGPVIFAANHSSIYDAILLAAYLPGSTRFVGPGDFRLRWPNRFVAEYTDAILVKRGSQDVGSLQAMMRTLKAGRPLAIFPEGGTWEKRLYSIKSGVSYLSLTCNAPVVPIGISGAYDIWRDIFMLKRPRIELRIGEPMDPVTCPDRKKRKICLERANHYLIKRIYSLLEPAEMQRYYRFSAEKFRGTLEFRPDIPVEWPDPVPDFAIVAELITKKNLFSSFHEHAKLPVTPFLRHSQFYRLPEFKRAVGALNGALRGSFKGYIEYRLGAEQETQAIEELDAMQAILDQVNDPSIQVRFTPHVSLSKADMEAIQRKYDQERDAILDEYAQPSAAGGD